MRQSSFNNSNATTPEADFDATKRRMSAPNASTENLNDTAQLLGLLVGVGGREGGGVLEAVGGAVVCRDVGGGE